MLLKCLPRLLSIKIHSADFLKMICNIKLNVQKDINKHWKSKAYIVFFKIYRHKNLAVNSANLNWREKLRSGDYDIFVRWWDIMKMRLTHDHCFRVDISVKFNWISFITNFFQYCVHGCSGIQHFGVMIISFSLPLFLSNRLSVKPHIVFSEKTSVSLKKDWQKVRENVRECKRECKRKLQKKLEVEILGFWSNRTLLPMTILGVYPNKAKFARVIDHNYTIERIRFENYFLWFF